MDYLLNPHFEGYNILDDWVLNLIINGLPSKLKERSCGDRKFEF